MKKCTKCTKLKELVEFGKASHHKDGLTSACKKCKYDCRNKDKVRQNYRKWSKANPEKEAKKTALYRNRHPGRVNALVSKRNAAKAQRTPKWLTKLHFSQIEMFYKAASALSKEFNIKMHVDHIVPLRGKTVSGLHVPWNLQVIPAIENTRKSNKIPNTPGQPQ